jgi:hypothetical protein
MRGPKVWGAGCGLVLMGEERSSVSAGIGMSRGAVSRINFRGVVAILFNVNPGQATQPVFFLHRRSVRQAR